jgi:PAS domain S-box-containing protein
VLIKLFVLIYLPIVVVISISLLLFAQYEEHSVIDKMSSRDKINIDIARTHILQKFKEIDSDLRIIAKLPALQHYLNTGDPALLDELAQFDLIFAKEKQRYNNVRIMNASGLEIMRINYNDGTPSIVPHEKLQDKSRRYFFNDTFNLNKDEIYVSPMDLGVEDNRLEIPYKPTIRFGMPVFDGHGHKKAIIMLNYLGYDLLLNFQTVMHEEGHNDMLINSNGYWLSSANPKDEWGFMLEKSDRTFGHDFADEWRTIATSDQGTLLTQKGLFIYSTIHPLLPGQQTSSGSNSVSGTSQHAMKPSDYYWKIILFTPQPILFGSLFYNQTSKIILILMIYLLIALGVFLVAHLALSRKQAKDELQQVKRDSEKAILDTFTSAIITIDKTGMVKIFNEAAKQIFGYNNSEILDKKVDCLMPTAFAAQHNGYLQHCTDSQDASIIGKRLEVEGLRKNGDIFSAILKVSPIQIDEELHSFCVIDDISETKAMQAQLAQAQKLEAIGQLAAGVAHEINTPIQFIGDNLSALQDNFTDIIAYQQELLASEEEAFKTKVHQLYEKYDLAFILEDSPKAIQQARDGIDRVAEIVKAMKTFAHVDMNSSTQRINVHDALKNALIISRNTYKYIAEIETDFAADIDMIECYPNELNQVFLNLIVNAAHAIEETKKGMGAIRITTHTLNTNYIEILIQDNGAGIAAENQEKVFNLFFTTKEVGKGTGQGLNLSYSIIVEKHHGKLFFESTLGDGTTFHIQLPINLIKQEASS